MTKLSGLELSSPVVAAAGFQNGLDRSLIIQKFDELLKTNVGAITLGSFTIPPNDGNEIKYGPPVYYYDSQAGKTYNSMGLANIGVDEAIRLAEYIIPAARRHQKLVIISGSPLGAEEFGTSVQQALELASKLLKTQADLVELNLSCPNIVTDEGGRKPIMGYDLKSIKELLIGLSKIKGSRRIGLKMPPYLTAEEKRLIPKIAKMFKQYQVGFIVTCNTIPNQIPKDRKGKLVLSVPGGAGGMSGPATKKIGREQLGLWKKYLPDSIDVISLLGVDSEDEIKHRIGQGAAAAGGATFVREKLPLMNEIKRSLPPSHRIILAIDTSNRAEAESLARLAYHSGARFIKLGLELSSATSWKYCAQLAKKHKLDWVADAKLDDIPNTVEKAVFNLKSLAHPPFGITMHITAGEESMRLAQAAAGDIKMLGVTVLTSMPEREASQIYGKSAADTVMQLAKMAKSAGLKGIVASPKEIGAIKKDPTTQSLFAMIPGSRSAAAEQGDQARVDTPAATIKSGADLLVIGRQVTQAKDPTKAYNQLLKEIEGALK